VALSGKDAGTVRRLIAPSSGTPVDSTAQSFMPMAPAVVAKLPAAVLARHPAVVSADREAEAAWADIGVAKANRLPRLNLAAALTGEWLSAAGLGQNFVTWSLGPTLSGTLFDGGAGAANVSAAEARYRRALATLDNTLRTTVQDVENALAAQTSAEARVRSAGDGLTAARTLLTTSEAQWRSGATSLLDLEDSRRQFATSRDAVITARRDQAQSWVALVKATGGAVTFSVGEHLHD
jgi:outer membrane protein TolC